MKFLGHVAVGIVVSGLLAGVRVHAAQPLCQDAEPNLIFQDTPGSGPHGQSPELFVKTIERLTMPVATGEAGSAPRRQRFSYPTRESAGGSTRRFCSRPSVEVNVVSEADHGREFLRCDPTDDGHVTLTAAVFILNRLFLRGREPRCQDLQDCNGDGAVNLSDPVHGLAALFGAGVPPSAPFPGCDGAPEPLWENSCPRTTASCR